MWTTALIISAAIGAAAPAPDAAGTATLAFRAPSPDQLYVSCSLYVAGEEIVRRPKTVEGRLEGSPVDPLVCHLHLLDFYVEARMDDRKFSPERCGLPGLDISPEGQKGRARLAEIYLRYFEKNAPRLAGRKGGEVLREAIIWACPADRRG